MRPCFIIAHKWIRGNYKTYLKYYINNINSFYKEALIIVVDNNSTYKEDIFNTITDSNVIFLDNNIECKFEIGAYTVGMNYIIDNNLLGNYDYYFFTQDNFIIKKEVDLQSLLERNIKACPINSFIADGAAADIVANVLSTLGLYNRLEEMTFCWCSSFIVHKDKIEQLLSYFKKIRITIRWESCASERYLARILYELNNYVNTDIDGDLRKLSYDCWTVNLLGEVSTYFAKSVQQKTENTKDA